MLGILISFVIGFILGKYFDIFKQLFSRVQKDLEKLPALQKQGENSV